MATEVVTVTSPAQSDAPPAGRTATVLSPLEPPVDPWNTSNQPPYALTYQFATTQQPGDLWDGYTGWTAFSDAEKNAVRAAFAEFASYINVTFTEVSGQADPDINLGKVTLGGAEGGVGGYRYSYSTTNGVVTSKTIDGYAVFNKTLTLTDADGRNLILHELGHAMTLKHPGNYDAGGNLPPGPFLPAAEDNNKYSVMSYNDNPDNGALSDHLMLYDIAALQQRWGANLSTRTGNDAYAAVDGLIQVIWDAGGTDTISGAAFGQVSIDLHEGAFSSLGGVNNLAIAYGAVIENATGGGGNDTLIGNAAANVLSGGGGNDTIRGFGGNDTIDGGAGSDTAVFAGQRADYTITHNGLITQVVGPDGTDSLTNIETLAFDDMSVPVVNGPSVPVMADLNGDQRSDLLWRNSDGTTFAWLMRAGGTNYDGSNLGVVPAQWHVQDFGDFNHDGVGDVLWRHDDGTTFIWLMKNAGTNFDGSNLGVIPNTWHVQGTGDFNGDGTTDILWRHNDGTTFAWLMNGGKRTTDVNLTQIPNTWHVQGIGDFDGDGDSDILWRNNDGSTNIFLMQNGQHVAVNSLGVVPTQWHVQGTGDFDGDGDTDILWRHNDGTTYEWLMQGGQHAADVNLQLISTNWTIQETADVDGDKDQDIIWRHNDGTTFAWLMQNGQRTTDVDLGHIPNTWTVQHHVYDIV
jgi:hypothetical protein